MVYQRVQKASNWIPATQRSNSSGSLHTHKLPTKPAGSVSSLQQKQESSQQFASDWMERDPVYRRIQAKMKATGEGASTDDSLAADTVQMKCSQCEAQEDVQQKPDSENSLEQEIQLSPQGQKSTEKSIQQLATKGFNGSPTKLPHLNQIQQSFGTDLSHVQAYVGGDAAKTCQQMGAAAYTSGNQIAFKDQPNLELAAHEAAHVVQQQSGRVQLAGGVGKVGDKYEQHADAVANKVAAGQSVKDLVAEYSSGSIQESVQTKATNFVQEQSSKQEKEPLQTKSDTIIQASFSGSSQNTTPNNEKKNSNTTSTHHSPWPWMLNQKSNTNTKNGTAKYGGRIEVRFNQLPMIDAYHAFIVVTNPFETDAAGKLKGSFYETFYRGGPQNQNPIDWGHIVTESGPYREATTDWNTSPKVDVVKNDLTLTQCNQYRSSFAKTLEAIQASKIAYSLPSPLGGCGGKANSNSTAYQAMRDAGFGVKPSVSAPCWEINPLQAERYKENKPIMNPMQLPRVLGPMRPIRLGW